MRTILLVLALLLLPVATATSGGAEEPDGHCPARESGLDGSLGTVADGVLSAVHGLCILFVAGADAAVQVTRLAVGWVAGLVQNLA